MTDAAHAAELKADLATIVLAAQKRAASPQRLHRIYTLLSPFTDGNGRCGRALLMWQIMRASERAKSRRSQSRTREARERPRKLGALNADVTSAGGLRFLDRLHLLDDVSGHRPARDDSPAPRGRCRNR